MKQLVMYLRVAAIPALSGAILLMHCGIKNPAETYNSWTFSGYVVDGYSGEHLSGVAVHYLRSETEEISDTTGKNGSFLIEGLPYGERSFRFTYSEAQGRTKYTEKTVMESCWKDAGGNTDGIAGDVSRTIKLFPCIGSLSGIVIIKLRESDLTIPAESANVRITFKDTSMDDAMPSVFEKVTDSSGSFTIDSLPLAGGLTVEIPKLLVNSTTYALSAWTSPQLLPKTNVTLGTIFMAASDTINWPINSVISNVISKDGFGITNAPITITPWYLLPSSPDSGSITATINDGGGNPEAIVSVHGDTVFVKPVRNLGYNASVNVTVSGKDRQGNRIFLNFGGIKQFKTEAGVFPVACNTWGADGQEASNFGLYDTMWAVFSQDLDTSLDKIEWQASDADIDIYGNGSQTNAAVWVSKDTLFVKPDFRLAVDYGKTIGFKVVVSAANGKRSGAIDFKAKLLENLYFVKWTNTKDLLGNMRTDFGVSDSVIVVSNMPVSEVTALSGISGLTPPADMTLDNVRVSGDTIIYKPSLKLTPNTVYGMDFDVTFANGIKRTHVLGAVWQVRSGVMILSTDNRQNGIFRAFKAIGDSLRVTFSKPIDTTTGAPVRFKPNMRDSRGITVRSMVKWDSACVKATIFPTDTLPTADYDASPAYTINAPKTRAIDSITFDLTTRDGEQVFQLGPANGKIEVHSEKGLCVTNASIVPGHDRLFEVVATETPVDAFDLDGAITITFSRAIDSVRMNAYGATAFIGIENKVNGNKVPCSIGFGSNARSVTITPLSILEVGKEYYIWLKNVPAEGILGAAAIAKHGGTYTGSGTNGRLLTKAFKTKSPDIQSLSVSLAPDTNTAAAVLENRLGASAGITYSSVVGSMNTVTSTSIKFLISEAAWNSRHGDSVAGYQVQIQKVDRRNSESGWYDFAATISSIPYSIVNPDRFRTRDAQIDLTTASFYNSLLSADVDGTGSFFLNSSNIFNDSSRVQVRVRPYIGSGDPLHGEVGRWSSPITFADNVAPCDSDFVTGANCNNLAKGGVQITESISFNNSAGSGATDTGYIEIAFPEDMDPSGTAPSITFFYGPMGTTIPSQALSIIAESGTKSRWINARKYRAYIWVPVFDYTNGGTDQGAYYNIDVAGCKDASGNLVQSYGNIGDLANTDISATGRATRTAAAAKQSTGSRSVIAGFTRCD